MGGGVDAGVRDRVMPFRPSAIRGMLRFWWRASRGTHCATVADLRDAEARVWGSTDKASRVSIEVTNVQLGTEVVAKTRVNGRDQYEEPRYALFPAQSDPVRNIYNGGAFDLVICFPNDFPFKDDVWAAVRYWVAFGGIGARTRRGCGAVFSKHFPGPFNWFVPTDFGGNGKRPWTTLKGARVVVGDVKRPLSHKEAWIKAVDLLKTYRQEKAGADRTGRSAWPEPDEIRRLTGQTAPSHATPVNDEGTFPRSKFGMPIIFHFRQDAHRRGDPSDQQLLPILDGEVRDRMGSPVILKPLAVSATHSVPICVVLNAPRPDGLELQGTGGRPAERVNAGNHDVVSEFLDLTRDRWAGTLYQI